jgi:hypothetical protein
MLTRVSNIETWRRWRSDEDATPADLIARLTAFEPTEAMLAGTALHKALELAQYGAHDVLTANGYTFLMPDASIEIPRVRELRCFGQYGPLRVTGQVDALEGLRVDDHKSTAVFNAEGYWDGCQWKFYLDIFGADRFRWNVFPLTPVRGKEKTYAVGEPQILEQCRYPGLHDDCMALARGFYEFAALHMPHHNIQLEAA